MTLTAYVAKMRGGGQHPPGVGLTEVGWSWAGSLLGISLCSYLSSRYFEPHDVTLLLGSFGASAVLVYAAIASPMAQPRNLVGGHMVSGLMGVLSYQLWGPTPWLAAGLGVSGAIVAMLEAVWKQSLCKTTPYAASVVRPKTELLENRSHIMLLEISNHLIY